MRQALLITLSLIRFIEYANACVRTEAQKAFLALLLAAQIIRPHHPVSDTSSLFPRMHGSKHSLLDYLILLVRTVLFCALICINESTHIIMRYIVCCECNVCYFRFIWSICIHWSDLIALQAATGGIVSHVVHSYLTWKLRVTWKSNVTCECIHLGVIQLFHTDVMLAVGCEHIRRVGLKFSHTQATELLLAYKPVKLCTRMRKDSLVCMLVFTSIYIYIYTVFFFFHIIRKCMHTFSHIFIRYFYGCLQPVH